MTTVQYETSPLCRQSPTPGVEMSLGWHIGPLPVYFWDRSRLSSQVFSHPNLVTTAWKKSHTFSCLPSSISSIFPSLPTKFSSVRTFWLDSRCIVILRRETSPPTRTLLHRLHPKREPGRGMEHRGDSERKFYGLPKVLWGHQVSSYQTLLVVFCHLI